MIDPKFLIGFPVRESENHIGQITDAKFVGNDLRIDYSTGIKSSYLVFKNLKLADSYQEGEESEEGMVTIKF